MRCVITTEGFGDMVFELFPDLAPITVKNFVDTAKSGFYDGLAWCRIVEDYVIQSGSPDNDIMTDSEWHIKGEFEENGIPNPIQHKRGALSMARDDDPDTAGTQFLSFIRMRISWMAAMRLLERWFPVLKCWMRLRSFPPTDQRHGISRRRCL